MASRFWLRLGKLGLLCLLAYLLLAYTIVVTIILRAELSIVEATKVISVFQTPQQQSILEAQVRNVFGDPIPHAVVIVGDHLVQADNTGVFQVADLKPGRHTLEIFAGDYAKYTREIQVEEGTNSPTIKYETGLWPQVFLVDFHIFYKDNDAIFGMIGFANGTTDPIYIERATLLSPRDDVICDLLHDHNGFAYYTDRSSKLEVVHEPQEALKWAPRMVQGGEFPPLSGYFPPGLYSLEVHYAFQEGHDLGQYQVLTIKDHLNLGNNWDPHLP
jgi:hypothetical protein